MPNGAVTLRLRFAPLADEPLRPEHVASVLGDLEGLYRVSPVAYALGIPVAGLLENYHLARADAAVRDLSADADIDEHEYGLREALDRLMRTYRRPYAGPELEDAFYLLYRLDRERLARRVHARGLGPPEHAMHLRRLSTESPMEVLTSIPAEYWQGGGFVLFLVALESRFNMVDRIRTERVELRARRAEAELRQERAARELADLRATDSMRLIDGEVRPEEPDDVGHRR